VWNVGGLVGGVVDTLLGPEDSVTWRLFFSGCCSWLLSLSGGGGWGGGGVGGCGVDGFLRAVFLFLLVGGVGVWSPPVC